jgi:hypothetical protein
MGKALELVNRFYDLTNNKNTTTGLRDLLDSNMTFSGPLLQTSGAEKYIEMIGQFIRFHKSWRMFKQFENGSEVCSIYEVELGTPNGGSFSVMIADCISLAGDRIAAQKIYYDPREFTKAFGL